MLVAWEWILQSTYMNCVNKNPTLMQHCIIIL